MLIYENEYVWLSVFCINGSTLGLIKKVRVPEHTRHINVSLLSNTTLTVGL